MKKLFLLTLTTTILFSCSEETKAPNPDTIIKGKITNADGNTAWLETYKNERTQVSINAAGDFEIKIALTQPACFDLVNGKARTYLCLAPGDTVNVSFDAKDITGTVKYEGKDAAFPNYLANKQRAINTLMSGQYLTLYSTTADTFLLKTDTLVSTLIAAFNQIKADTSINKTILAWEEKAINYDKIALILDYPYYYRLEHQVDTVAGLDKILAATKNISAFNPNDLTIGSYRNALNCYLNYCAGNQLAGDTSLCSHPEGKEKAIWNAIENNITDASVKDYLAFNFVNKNEDLSIAAEAKAKLKAATKDTIYQKQLK